MLCSCPEDGETDVHRSLTLLVDVRSRWSAVLRDNILSEIWIIGPKASTSASCSGLEEIALILVIFPGSFEMLTSLVLLPHTFVSSLSADVSTVLIKGI